jgi:hypothetical protein
MINKHKLSTKFLTFLISALIKQLKIFEKLFFEEKLRFGFPTFWLKNGQNLATFKRPSEQSWKG